MAKNFRSPCGDLRLWGKSEPLDFAFVLRSQRYRLVRDRLRKRQQLLFFELIFLLQLFDFFEFFEFFMQLVCLWFFIPM